jgi:hypothetical protein
LLSIDNNFLIQLRILFFIKTSNFYTLTKFSAKEEILLKKRSVLFIISICLTLKIKNKVIESYGFVFCAIFMPVFDLNYEFFFIENLYLQKSCDKS